MVNKALTNDIAKGLKNVDLGGSKELPAGATPRRYEPAGGVNKHNERIHNESKWVDENRNLPFTFSKPNKDQRQKLVKCLNCGALKMVNKNTVGVICSGCKQYSSVEEIND